MRKRLVLIRSVSMNCHKASVSPAIVADYLRQDAVAEASFPVIELSVQPVLQSLRDSLISRSVTEEDVEEMKRQAPLPRPNDGMPYAGKRSDVPHALARAASSTAGKLGYHHESPALPSAMPWRFQHTTIEMSPV